jgi:hypothetical protein
MKDFFTALKQQLCHQQRLRKLNLFLQIVWLPQAAATTTSFDVCGRDYIFLRSAIAIFALSATVLVLLCHPNPNAKYVVRRGRNKARNKWGRRRQGLHAADKR